MDLNKRRGIVFFLVVIFFWLYTFYNNIWGGVIVFTFVLVLGILIILFPDATVNEGDYNSESYEHVPEQTSVQKDCLVYYGNELNFQQADIITALTRHFPFYNSLNIPSKQKFIERLNSFIEEKVFKIHDSTGFREMPILISASAIQLSFGLDKYLLPNFNYINIYPEEFVRVRETICFLEGNVSGHSINISWKHFLEGFELPNDGANVGLHEMAHAYYYQSFGPCAVKDENFITAFNEFNECGNKVFNDLPTTTSNLYSDYAKRNFQEFWAESVEIFFERSLELQNTYPALFTAMSNLLNQHPQQTVIE